MKLEMSLPTRPGLIHAIPGIDIIALLLILPTLGSSFTSNAGIEIQLTPTKQRFNRVANSIEITLKGSSNTKIWVNKRLVKEKDLLKEITTEIGNTKKVGSVGILFIVDNRVPSGYKYRISSLLAEHYRVFDVGIPATSQ